MKLMATKELTYGTRRLQAGDLFKASNGDGLALVAIGTAKPAPMEASKPAAPAQPEETSAHPRRGRRRNQGGAPGA